MTPRKEHNIDLLTCVTRSLKAVSSCIRYIGLCLTVFARRIKFSKHGNSARDMTSVIYQAKKRQICTRFFVFNIGVLYFGVLRLTDTKNCQNLDRRLNFG